MPVTNGVPLISGKTRTPPLLWCQFAAQRILWRESTVKEERFVAVPRPG